jgi:upstream activation factor subunit UAF30
MYQRHPSSDLETPATRTLSTTDKQQMAPQVAQTASTVAPTVPATKKQPKTVPADSTTAPPPAPATTTAGKNTSKNGGASKAAPSEAKEVKEVKEGDNATESTMTAEEAIDARYAAMQEKLTSAFTMIKELMSELKATQKDHKRLQVANANAKAVTKGGKGKGKKAPAVDENGEIIPAKKRTASGFAMPALLSDDMCAFLNKEKGSKLARTDVTRLLNQYIKENNLQNPKDKRTINPDAKLKAILTPAESYTYFNLQSHIKHHFVKSAE